MIGVLRTEGFTWSFIHFTLALEKDLTSTIFLKGSAVDISQLFTCFIIESPNMMIFSLDFFLLISFRNEAIVFLTVADVFPFESKLWFCLEVLWELAVIFFSLITSCTFSAKLICLSHKRESASSRFDDFVVEIMFMFFEDNRFSIYPSKRPPLSLWYFSLSSSCVLKKDISDCKEHINVPINSVLSDL